MATIAEGSTHPTNMLCPISYVRILGRKKCTHTLTRFSTFDRITTVCFVPLDQIYQWIDTFLNVSAFCWHWQLRLTGLIGAENDVKRYEETMRINRIINTIKTEVQKKIPLKLTIYL